MDICTKYINNASLKLSLYTDPMKTLHQNAITGECFTADYQQQKAPTPPAHYHRDKQINLSLLGPWQIQSRLKLHLERAGGVSFCQLNNTQFTKLSAKHSEVAWKCNELGAQLIWVTGFRGMIFDCCLSLVGFQTESRVLAS